MENQTIPKDPKNSKKTNSIKFKPKKKNESSKDEVVKLDHRSHILKLPDTYIGSTDKTKDNIWGYNYNDSINDSIIFSKENRTYIPGEYKIFDEIIVNALDQYIRTGENPLSTDKVKNIYINVNKDTGEIEVKNDGEGIPIKVHSKEKIYIPELIFGHLLTSTNYDDKKTKHVGGKNGYGAKLTNIYSVEFNIETADGKNKYSQTFYDNMSRKDEPKIVKSKIKPYTLIRYKPDYKRFNLENISLDMISIMNKRAYDMAICADKANIYYNGDKIICKNFENYMNYYIGDNSIKAIDKVNRWEIGVALNNTETFESISFVNGIYTSNGGKHVDYVVNQITRKLIDWVLKKKKITIKPNFIKDNIIVFIKCTIDDPSFTSQTKEYLSTNKDKFGSKYDISDKFITQITKTGIVEKAIEIYEQKNNKLLKKTDGKKQNILKGIPKLEDANWAGTKKSSMCTLILTEGDSAKSMAMAGMSVIGRDKHGVFPLKGKILNVKDTSNIKKLLDNKEIANIRKIMGLQIDEKYTPKNIDKLRYGRIMVLTDQDEDGSHIKGLLFNLFESLWPSLFDYTGFLISMLTPVVKIKKQKNEKSFYSVKDFDKWKLANNNGKGWNAKYYKGLGTSTAKEAKDYFKAFKCVEYTTNKPNDKQSIHMAFSKQDGSSDIRKTWLTAYDKNKTLDYTSKKISVEKFINEDLIHFSASDCVRSFPNIIDGLKPSQRKVLYSCFKRKLFDKEIRVAQLAGYVSEHAAYHHGEMSLHGTIINMAQDFVGSNNCNLLVPEGQFGTRIGGGKDAAQPRYIQTKLSKISPLIFNNLDNPLYTFNKDDDNENVEPEFYVPVLPLGLINGSKGIGTGWSTDIPCFNTMDIIDYIKNNINGKPTKELEPYYNNFKGEIIKKTNNIYISKGIYNIQDGLITITELPIGTWTDNYKIYLETLLIDCKNSNKTQILRNYKSYCTDTEVNFELYLKEDTIWELNKFNEKLGMTKLEKILKLVSTINMNNMVAFDSNNKIKKYSSIDDIMTEYIDVRLETYNKRKEYLLNKLEKEIKFINLKIRFIKEYISEEIIIHKRTKSNVIEQLDKGKYPLIDNSYDYLLKMTIDSLTQDKIDDLDRLFKTKETEYNTINNKNNKELWVDDIDNIELILGKTSSKKMKKVKKIKKIKKASNVNKFKVKNN